MKLLQLLKKSEGHFVSGARLAEALGVTRAGVHKNVQRLRALGHAVQAVPRKGYRLQDSPQALDPSELKDPWGKLLVHKPVMASTQEEAKRRAVAGAPEGTLIVADRQTAGRGRWGRAWESPVGGLWFSLLLKPRLSPAQAPALTLVAALEMARTLQRRTGLTPALKWPNDIWWDGRKLAGFLTEMSAEADRVHWLVLGVGVNVNNPAPKGLGLPAVSLRAALGRTVSRQLILSDWLGSFHEALRKYERDGFSPFKEAFEKLMLFRWNTVELETAAGPLVGEIRGVDDLGRLSFLKAGQTAPDHLLEGEIRLKLTR